MEVCGAQSLKNEVGGSIRNSQGPVPASLFLLCMLWDGGGYGVICVRFIMHLSGETRSSPAVCVHVNNVTGDRRKLGGIKSGCSAVQRGPHPIRSASNQETCRPTGTAAYAHTLFNARPSSDSFINIISNCPVHCGSIDAECRQRAGSIAVHRNGIILSDFPRSHKTEVAEYRCSCGAKPLPKLSPALKVNSSLFGILIFIIIIHAHIDWKTGSLC